MNQHSHTVFFLGFELDQERLLWDRVLKHADTLGCGFSKGLPAYSDLFFVTLDSSFSAIMLKKAKNDSSTKLIFVSKSDDIPAEFKDFAIFSLDDKEEVLIDLLRKCLQEGNVLSLEKDGHESKIPKEGEVLAFSSVEMVSKLLFSAFKTPFAVAIKTASTTLFLDLREKIIYINKEFLTEGLISHQKCILAILADIQKGGEIEFIQAQQLTNNSPEQFITIDLDMFLWGLGEKNEEHLLVNASINALFAITLWPDFGLIKLNPNLLRVCARLVKQPLTIKMIMELFNIEEKQCIKFLNALALCQYLIWDADDNAIESSYEEDQVSALSLSEISLLRNDLTI